MSGIPKGSILEEVSPYIVVPLYNDTTATPSSDFALVGSKSSRIEMDPTRVPGLEGLPKWEECPIWSQRNKNQLFENPGMKKFLRRVRRMTSSSADDVFGSWQVLCILAILRVVADNACIEKESQHSNKKNESASPWWSALASKDYDDDREQKMIPDGGNHEDDDDGSLLVELWPLIREHIPWVACQRLYHRIQQRLHVLTIAHPLKLWAQKTLFELTDDEFETSWMIFQSIKAENTAELPNRLRASKLWLDRVANIPDRFVGVLIDDPSKIVIRHCPTKSDSTALNLPRCYQSCLPNTCLELHVDTAMENTPDGSTELESNEKIRCRWIALYDLSFTESQITNRTLSTMPKPSECDFFDAHGNTKIPPPKINASNLAQARRLAHSHFFKEDFGDATSLYRQCYDFCSSSLAENTEIDTNSKLQKERTEWRMKAQADLWHAMGAVILSQQKFALAQEHWRNGCHYQIMHKEISEQLEKQKAYQYFDPLPEPCPSETTSAFEQEIFPSRTSAMNAKNRSIFVASEVVDLETCRRLIGWAREYALDNGGWTASRHYAVPTTDLPIHKVPKLLKWFQYWMPQVLFPLLQNQFGSLAGSKSRKRFYVHDAFLVRYEATASSCFLPLHFDESTHSVVLALNDDFDGGGSYIYDLDRSIAPETGGMVSFLGNQCLHGGNPVTRGVRYILAIFLFLDRDLARNSSKESSNEKTNGTKRREQEAEVSKEESIVSSSTTTSKRPKKDDSVHGGGGFSFSFF